jgi:putative FmdB family regulatory protein
MPIYEFRCAACSRITSVFTRTVSSPVEPPKCQNCGAGELSRVVSKVGRLKTEQDVLEQYGVPEAGAGPDAYRDPRQIGRWAEKRFEEMGVEMPEEARTMIQAAREGEFPDPVKDL